MPAWLASYGLLLRWSVLQRRMMLPMMLAIQVVMSAGIVVGFAFLIPEIDADSAAYLSIGAVTISLIVTGLVLAPNTLSEQKQNGVFDFQRSMPVPRLAMLLAEATVWVVLAVPGVLAGLAVAALRFDLEFQVSPLAGPAVLLVALTCTTLGYAVAYALPPMVTLVVSQMLVFFVLMFSPINFPAERLPGWFAAVHDILPFAYMAQSLRDTILVPADGVSATPFVVLTLWCLGGFVLAYGVMIRRS